VSSSKQAGPTLLIQNIDTEEEREEREKQRSREK
jgi:hypothetical protein